MFKFPNGTHVDYDGLKEAMLSTDTKTTYFFDTKNGHVGLVLKKNPNKELDPKRYILVPTIPEQTQVWWLHDMISVFISLEDPLLARALLRALKDTKSGYAKARTLLEKHKDGWIHGWAQWQEEDVGEKMDTWLSSLDLGITDVFEPCGDCEMCKLQAEGGHSVEEFIEASEKQNKKKSEQETFDIVDHVAPNATFPRGQGNVSVAKTTMDEYYYDAMESIEDVPAGNTRAERLLKEALKIDETYVQTWIGLANVYDVAKKKKRGEECIKRAYDETVKQFPTWPPRMEWGVLEHRPYLRAIHWRGELYMDGGEIEKGLELLRLCLKLNPNDNQGIRYIVAMNYAGRPLEDVNTLTDKGNRLQDWSELDTILTEQNKRHMFWEEPRY